MAKSPKKSGALSSVPAAGKGESVSQRPVRRGQLWCFRVLAAVGLPLVLLVVLEGVLRVCGVGYPTSFLLRTSEAGQEAFQQNNQFGWRFFGPRLSRLPSAVWLAREKPADTIRIFVFGESAAKGEPQPAFGLPRMLETVLRLRYPGVRFQVVNAAMTAINSHAVREIARDCRGAGGDVWVVYMGNNEVVGPFGAGTVFGRQIPPLGVVRASLAMKSTRTGQVLDTLFGALKGPSPESEEWRGMQMFLSQQVRGDDSRLGAVYRGFEENLRDIMKAGQACGARMVVSTVAVNLKDCAPFASEHRVGLSETEVAAWNRAYEMGVRAHEAGNMPEALKNFEEATKIDGDYAALRFRQGTCEFAMGRVKEARTHLKAACDLDTLRFRCDSRLNEITRRMASGRESEGIVLADAEQAFVDASTDGVLGGDLFYEHVHPTIQGNYVLARTIAERVEKLMAARLAGAGRQPTSWPALEVCARSLGWSDWNRLAALQDILGRVGNRPFTEQLNHEAHLRALTGSIEGLSNARQPAGIQDATEKTEAALARSPDDAPLLVQLAYLKQLANDYGSAEGLARRALERLPSDSQTWVRLGLILVSEQKLDEAAKAFRRAIRLDPTDALALQNLGQSLWMTGQTAEAKGVFRRAVKVQPNFAIAWLDLGSLLAEGGSKVEAESCFRKAFSCRTTRATDLLSLARFSRSRGWREATLTNYAAAIDANPGDARLQLEAGECLLGLQLYPAAADRLAEAVRLTPDSAKAHQLYGSALGQEGKAEEAEREFRETLRLAPNLLEARLNLGIAVMSQGRSSEALALFDEVLQVSPTNGLAIKYAQALRTGANSIPPR